MEHRIVITRHRPWLKPALIGGGSFVLALAAWGLYVYTRASTVSDFERAQLEVERLREERRELTRQLRAARDEIKRLQEQVVYVQRSQDIDAQACSVVRESLAQLQAEASDLREQLAFYRGIVAPEQSRVGVRVHEFKLVAAAEPGRFRYGLVLIQAVRHDKRVGGRIDLQLVGERSGAEERLPWAAIAADGAAENLLFSLKYFEEFSGEIVVPQGFKPMRVVVTLIPEGDDATRIEESFDWDRILSGAGA
ncbi:hypothetical protein SAMN04488120_106120 [Fontimonas thermophila]|uniref:Transmembrane protein n=1 Tax=Fontimonas thermophila TaxID=1076937 RepID=A0A1I2JCI7_9GAMM|nr:DUF6776 family protein [Fontimonas thermophila]SFF51553.1 hypothetical protein SAMN04488120_106120 [Fontimonas thermophila]